MTIFLTNPAPSEPVPIEIKIGWSKLAVRVQSIFDQDLTEIAFSIDNINILKRPYTTGFLELDFGATPGATYTLVVGSVDEFVGADNDLLMAGILGNSDLVRTYKQEITFREYPVLDSVENIITRDAFTVDNLVVASSGFAEFMDVEYSTDNSNWAPLYSGSFNTYLVTKLPIGNYFIRVRYSINIAANIDTTTWQYSTVGVVELGTSLVEEMQEQLDDARDAIVDLGNDNKMRIQRIEYDLNSAQKQLLQTTDYARQIQQQASELTNAFFFVDPENGTITNLAFSYTDNQFTQAALLIDGVTAEVLIQAQRVTSVEDRITNAESEIEVQAGQIALRATFTDVNEIVAGAIDAILPAYSFGFFAGSDGWSAVNGTLTTQPSRVLLTWGDITNQALGYIAEENPTISISFERTGGSGWDGSLIVTFGDSSTQTYSGVIDNIPGGGVFVRNLNLANVPTYTGTVTGLRLVLGTSVDDTFTISQITIGKPSAALQELEGLTLQVNQLGINIDAVNASLTNYVTTLFFNDNAVTLNNVEAVLDGTDAIISLKATQTELGTQGTVSKANAANVWIDSAEANITSVVQSYNAQTGGIDDQLDAIDGEFTAVQQTLDAQNGRISNSIVAISKLDESAKKDRLDLLLAEYSLYLRKKGELELGVGVSTAKFDIAAVTNSVQAVAQSVLELDSSFGTALGQIDSRFNQTNQAVANETSARTTAINNLTVSFNGQLAAQSQLIQDVQAGVNGNSSAIASLNTRASNLENFSQAQLILNSEYNAELNTLESRAFLGTTNVVGGKATISGIFVGGVNNLISFQGDVFELANTAGQRRLYWDSASNTWVFNGRLVVGGYTVNSEADIRALDGAGFYGATYANIDWTTSVANARFSALVGRLPVNLDIFTQTTSYSSEALQYNGSYWAPVALQVNGSLIASGTVAGDRFIAGTEISGPIIKGGELIAVGPNTEYFEVIRPEPFGPQNDLVNWFGPKVNGVTWDNTTGQPIYSGMTKANAQTYKTKNGSAYFGGTIIAGTLKNAVQTSILTSTPSVETGVFGSNGGQIVVKCSFSAARSQLSDGTCPVAPANPTGTMFLDRFEGGTWVQVASQSMTGSYSCSQEGPEYIEDWQLNQSFTYYDNLLTSTNRNYRLRATHNTPLLPNGNLRLALVTEE